MKDFNQHVAQMALHINLSEEYIHNLFLDTADEFLRGYAGSESAAKVWKATPEFWAWWQQIWLGRDKMMVTRYPQRITCSGRQRMYEVWHDPKLMHMTPNSMVYDSFIRTMKQQQILINQIA